MVEKITTGHKYRIKYDIKVDCGEFTRDEIKKEGVGGCDAFIFFSIIYPEDGSYSQTFYSSDGRNEGRALGSSELWKVWAMMTKNLVDRKDDLPEWKYLIADSTMEMIWEMMKR